MGSVVVALVLTGLGALGTALGGLLVVLQPNMSFKRLGAVQVGHQNFRTSALAAARQTMCNIHADTHTLNTNTANVMLTASKYLLVVAPSPI
jgi:hypothetical protein